MSRGKGAVFALMVNQIAGHSSSHQREVTGTRFDAVESANRDMLAARGFEMRESILKDGESSRTIVNSPHIRKHSDEALLPMSAR